MSSSQYKVIDTPIGKACYEIIGEGEPVLIIHGSGGGTEQSRLIAERLLPSARAICAARFAYQDSVLPEQADTAKQASAYLSMLDAERIDKAHVVAFSAGGPSAAEFASRYPSRCLSLTLISAVGSPSLQKGLKARLAFSQLKDPDMIYGLLTLLSKRSERLSFLGASKEIRKRLENEEDEHFLDLALKNLKNPKHLKGALNDRNLKPLADTTYQAISCPTLIIHSQNDRVVPIENAEHALSLIPHAESHILTQGGHMLFTRHAKIKEKIRNFWKSRSVNT